MIPYKREPSSRTIISKSAKPCWSIIGGKADDTDVSFFPDAKQYRRVSIIRLRDSISLRSWQNAVFRRVTKGLIYSQIWEDPVIDLEALRIESHHRVMTIGSGGCNALSYLVADPAEIIIVDINASQIALNRLKIAAMKFLPDYKSFFNFFGAADKSSNVKLCDDHICANLDENTRTYWVRRDARGRRRIEQFARGFYRQGLAGQLIAMCHIYSRVHGTNLSVMLDAKDLKEQRDIYAREVKPLFHTRTIRGLAALRPALFGLGIPPVQYETLKANRSMHLVLEERAERMICDFDLKENYFAWQFFDRGYAPDGGGPLPIYLQREHFAEIRSRIDRLQVRHISFVDQLRSLPDQYLDRYVLLDSQDWMNDQSLTELWSELTRTARPGSRVIFRTAGRNSVLPGRIPAHLLERWDYEKDASLELLARDRSAIYGGFHLYVLKGTQ